MIAKPTHQRDLGATWAEGTFAKGRGARRSGAAATAGMLRSLLRTDAGSTMRAGLAAGYSAQVKESAFNAWPVVGNDGLRGMVRSREIEEAAANNGFERQVSEILGAGVPIRRLAKGYRTSILTIA